MQTGSEAEAERMAVEIAESYKDYAPIQYFLYGIATKKQDWARALPYAENANRIEKRALSYLSLASVLHQLDRHQETVDAVYKALELEPSRIAKTAGILEGIASLAILNRKQEAKDLAQKHMDANPNWRDNPTFVDLVTKLGMLKG